MACLGLRLAVFKNLLFARSIAFVLRACSVPNLLEFYQYTSCFADGIQDNLAAVPLATFASATQASLGVGFETPGKRRHPLGIKVSEAAFRPSALAIPPGISLDRRSGKRTSPG
jgi:hypothetical protein